MTDTQAATLEARLTVLGAALTHVLAILSPEQARQVRNHLVVQFSSAPGHEGRGEGGAEVDAAQAGQLWTLLRAPGPR